MKVLLTHTPDMLRDYYGPRALTALREIAEVRLNETGSVLDAAALARQAEGCAIVVSDRQTPGEAAFFAEAPGLVAFLRCAVDIRTIDVPAASQAGILVTRATPGFQASVAEMAIGMMIDLARGITEAAAAYRADREPTARMGRQLKSSTLGLIGYGAIARDLAPIAQALGMLMTERLAAAGRPTTGAMTWAYGVVGMVQLTAHWWSATRATSWTRSWPRRRRSPCASRRGRPGPRRPRPPAAVTGS